MDGATALWYARSRFETNDFDRMERQRQVQEAILTQVEPSVVLSKFQGIVQAGAQVVSTDIPSVMLPGFVDMASRARTIPVTKLELVPPTIDQNFPDYDLIHTLVQSSITEGNLAG